MTYRTCDAGQPSQKTCRVCRGKGKLPQHATKAEGVKKWGTCPCCRGTGKGYGTKG